MTPRRYPPAASEAQFEAYRLGRLPETERVRDGVFSIAMEMPGGHLPYSLCYVIRDRTGALHVVDPGLDTEPNRVRLRALLDELGGGGAVATVVVTHLHPDHLGMGAHLRDTTGATLTMHRAEAEAIARSSWSAGIDADDARLDAWGVPDSERAALSDPTIRLDSAPPPPPDAVVDDGDMLPVAGGRWRVIHTPGHTPGHLCLVAEEERLVLTGDHLMPHLHGGIGLGGDSSGRAIAEYLAAVDALAPLDGYEAAPGHEYRFLGIADRCASTAAHHRARSAEVRAAMDGGARTAWDVARTLRWSRGWDALTGFLRRSALLQTAMHMDYLRGEGGRAPAASEPVA